MSPAPSVICNEPADNAIGDQLSVWGGGDAPGRRLQGSPHRRPPSQSHACYRDGRTHLLKVSRKYTCSQLGAPWVEVQGLRWVKGAVRVWPGC